MALEEFKRLEALKEELGNLSGEFSKLILRDRKRILNQISEEYESFLSGEGFTVTRKDNIIQAIYKSLTLILTIPRSSEPFIGAISVLDIADTRYQQDTWKIAVLVDTPSTRDPSFVPIINKEDENHNSVSQKIESLKRAISEHQPLKYCFRFYRESDATRDPNLKQRSPIFTSIREVITGIINTTT